MMTNLFSQLGRIGAAIAVVLALPVSVHAADLKVYSTIGVQSALEELLPKFETESGHKVSVTWGTAAMLLPRLQGGEGADLVVLTQSGIDALAKDGKVAPGSAAVLAHSSIAMAVKAGAPVPDISTPDAFKRALLAAKSIAYSDPTAGGASGVYVSKLFERMGIAGELRAKTKFPPPGGNSETTVMAGPLGTTDPRTGAPRSPLQRIRLPQPRNQTSPTSDASWITSFATPSLYHLGFDGGLR